MYKRQGYNRAERRPEAFHGTPPFLVETGEVSGGSRQANGEVAMRTPVSYTHLDVYKRQSLFYLGHIGYHVDPPFRGHGAALRACRLCVSVLAELGMRTFVITTDEDNLPSILTCERLGCTLECSVDVPLWCRQEFSISERKRRYVYDPAAVQRR